MPAAASVSPPCRSARRLGAIVIAAAGSDEKRAAAKEAGADYIIDYVNESLPDRVKAITKNAGVDVVYDAVGGDVFDACVRAIAWGGRLLIVGFASGRIPEIPANRLLLKGASAVGVYWGSFAARDPAANARNFERLFELYAQKKIGPEDRPASTRSKMRREQSSISKIARSWERRVVRVRY